ncbi:MAG: sugar phosphate nucleotidyltransferase [Candidatus Ratteibacteria bacterium]|jgi:UTP--glucose-1-phosphate uridylyltransferase
MIKKVVLPIAGLGTRFLPLSKELPKEFWPLADLPVIQYIVEEAVDSGAEEIIFVISPEKKMIVDYFGESPKVNEILKERNRTSLIKELDDFKKRFEGIKFSYVTQKNPLGDGHAILQAEKEVAGEPCGILFGDDVTYSKKPCLAQLADVYKTCQKPVIAIRRVPKEMIPSYGILEVEKIANRFYKIKKIIEKPSLEDAPSDFAIVGKYLITSQVFDYLKKGGRPSKGKEMILADAFERMISDGKTVYGYEFEGDWLECGNKANWLKSHLFLSLKHPEFGPLLKKYLKDIL